MKPTKESAPQAAKPSGAAEAKNNYARIDFAEVKRRHPVDEYCRSHGIELKRQSGNLVGLCPLHVEDSPSFTIFPDHHYHCFGCGAHGDVVDLEQALGGGTRGDAVRRLGEVPVAYTRPTTATASKAEPERKQFHPDLSGPSPDDLKVISALRSINVECLEIAVERGFLWTGFLKSQPAWVLTDQTRQLYLARRLDGEPRGHLDSKPKAWLLPGSKAAWPLGIEESEPYPAIALCEGGPDFLSAFAHAWASGVEDRVAPVCMTSASVTIPDEALPYFQGKRTRIFVHDDAAGYKAAKQWTRQLCRVVKLVDGFTVDKLIQADGTPVKDLNDLLRVDYDCWEEQRQTIDAVMGFAMEGQS
jgi:hypothetical protein